MKQDNTVDSDDVINLAEMMGIPFAVQISTELAAQLQPNEFLASFGISYSERVKNLLNSLRANVLPNTDGCKQPLPKGGVVFHLPIVIGPLIKEDLISIRAEMTDEGGEKGILLTAILEKD